MEHINARVFRKLALLAILLGIIFFMRPVQQTAYALGVCCSRCGGFYSTCLNGCSSSSNCVPTCQRVLHNCQTTCNPGC